jgi:hypothetical protein
VRSVGVVRGQRDLTIAGHLDHACAQSLVGERDAMNLNVVLGRDHHVDHGLDADLRAADFRSIRVKAHLRPALAAVQIDSGGRPDVTAGGIAQIKELPPIIAGRV